MIIKLIEIVVLVGGGFVFGVLFGRKNRDAVDTAVNEVVAVEKKVASKLKKK